MRCLPLPQPRIPRCGGTHARLQSLATCKERGRLGATATQAGDGQPRGAPSFSLSPGRAAARRMFCQATGFGGTVQQGRTVEAKLRERDARRDEALEAAAAAREARP